MRIKKWGRIFRYVFLLIFRGVFYGKIMRGGVGGDV